MRGETRIPRVLSGLYGGSLRNLSKVRAVPGAGPTADPESRVQRTATSRIPPALATPDTTVPEGILTWATWPSAAVDSDCPSAEMEKPEIGRAHV